MGEEGEGCRGAGRVGRAAGERIWEGQRGGGRRWGWIGGRGEAGAALRAAGSAYNSTAGRSPLYNMCALACAALNYAQSP